MKKAALFTILLTAMLFTLSGCNTVGDKGTNMSIIYGAVALLSLALLIAYILVIRQKTLWFYLLFSSVLVVNIGYFILSVSRTLTVALIANSIAYLGSVFLPFSMLMSILNTLELRYHKRLPLALCCVNILIFCITATPGILPIYYKEVQLKFVNGVAVLDKVYGPLHFVYLIFLLMYFGAMICAIYQAAKQKKLTSAIHSLVLLAAVFSNIGVWLLEQLVKIDFEFLSVSYIISELFLLGLYFMLQAAQKAEPMPAETDPSKDPEMERAHRYLLSQLPLLTPAEHKIYQLYIEGRTTKEVIAKLFITENTLKYHNKNIYGKLGVSSRKQLLAVAAYQPQNTEK